MGDQLKDFIEIINTKPLRKGTKPGKRVKKRKRK